MMIRSIDPSIDYNEWFKRLDTQLHESTNQNSIIVLKVVRPTNKNTFNKTLETRVINRTSHPGCTLSLFHKIKNVKITPFVGILKLFVENLKHF